MAASGKKGGPVKVLLILMGVVALGMFIAVGLMWDSGKESTGREMSEEEMEAASHPGTSRAVDIEPVAGIRIQAAENAMDKDRPITLAFADEKQWDRATEVMKEETAVIPLCAFEFDAGMEPQERIPGTFDVSMDLGQMGIPPELYERMQVWRIAEDGSYYRYSTRIRGDQLCFSSNQNSLLLVALGTAVTSLLVLKGVQMVQGVQMRWFFNTDNKGDKYNCMSVPVDNDDGDFTIYFKWSSTERPGGGKAFLDNENKALARVEELGKQVDAEIERMVSKAASGKEEMGWWDAWWLSDKREAARKTIDREAMLQQKIAHDPVLTELNSSPDAQLPNTVLQVIQMVKLAQHYLYHIAKVKPLTYALDVYLLEKRVIESAGMCVNPVGNGLVDGNPFLYVNIDFCLDTDAKTGSKTFSTAAEKGQSALLTITHELFHACQQTNYCSVQMGMYAAEATAGVLECDAARWFYKNGIIKANVDAPNNDNLQMSPREYMEVFARPLNEMTVTDKYSILDLSSPKRLYEKTAQEIMDASDVGYTMAYLIEAAREYAGKPDRSMHYIVEQYPDHGSPFSELVRWGIPLSEAKFDKTWMYFCDLYAGTMYYKQSTQALRDVADKRMQECYTTIMTLGEGAPVRELTLDKKDFYFRTWEMRLMDKSGSDYNFFVTDKTDGALSPYVLFYCADSDVGFKNKGNKPSCSVKGSKRINVAAAVSSYSKEQETEKYYAVGLFKPREIKLNSQNRDTVVFTLPPVGSDLLKQGLITGAVVTFYPAKGQPRKLTVEADKLKKPVKWVLDGISKEGGPFSLSCHWFYKESDKVTYESPESEKYSFTAQKYEEEVQEPEPVEPENEPTESEPDAGLIRPTLEVPYAAVNVSVYGLISKEEDSYLTCVKSPAVWGFGGSCWADKGEISVVYEGKGRWHIVCNATCGDYEEGKNKSSSATVSMSLYYQMQLGEMVHENDHWQFKGIEETLSGTYSISYKQYIQANCEWYDYSKNEWHFDYCTDTATSSGSFKDFYGWSGSYMREGSTWSCSSFSGIPLSFDFQDSFMQAVGDKLVPRHVDATLDDLLALKAKKEQEIAAGEHPYWEGGRGFITILLDLDLDKDGDGDPNTRRLNINPLKYEEVL